MGGLGDKLAQQSSRQELFVLNAFTDSNLGYYWAVQAIALDTSNIKSIFILIPLYIRLIYISDKSYQNYANLDPIDEADFYCTYLAWVVMDISLDDVCFKNKLWRLFSHFFTRSI